MSENNSSLHKNAQKLSFSTFLASLLIAVLPLILIRFSATTYKIFQNSSTLWIILVLMLISLVSGLIAIRRTKIVLLWLIPILTVLVYIGWNIYQITQPSKIPIGWIPEGIYADESNHKNNEKTEWPQTLTDAVEIIIRHLSEKDKEMIKSASKYELISFHHGWGTQIRNEFGLWSGNQVLMENCGASHPDETSMVIIEAVWKKLKQQKNEKM